MLKCSNANTSGPRYGYAVFQYDTVNYKSRLWAVATEAIPSPTPLPTHPNPNKNLTRNSNRTNPHFSCLPYWNLAQSTAMTLPCFVQNFKTFRQWINQLWTNEPSRDSGLRGVSEGYHINCNSPTWSEPNSQRHSTYHLQRWYSGWCGYFVVYITRDIGSALSHITGVM